MHYRDLGRTGLKVSLLSFGTGGPSILGQNTGLSPKQQDDLVRRYLDVGVNLFDTSEMYSDSEEILGRALKGVPRDSYIVATKWSHNKDDTLADDPQELTTSMGNSLRRLGTDHVDIMQFHGVLPDHYGWLIDRFYPTLKRLQEDGKTRFIGFTEVFSLDPTHEVVVSALRNDAALWDTIMLKYGILNQNAAKEALPLAIEHGVGILNMSAIREKLSRLPLLEELMADWRRLGVIPRDGLPEADPLGWLVHGDVDSVVSAGYKFGADHPAVSTVLTGTSNVDHLEANLAALEKPFLPEADKQRLMEVFRDVAIGRDKDDRIV